MGFYGCVKIPCTLPFAFSPLIRRSRSIMSNTSIFRVIDAAALDVARDVFICLPVEGENTKGSAGRPAYHRFPIRSSCTVGNNDRRIVIQLVPGTKCIVQKDGAKELKRMLLRSELSHWKQIHETTLGPIPKIICATREGAYPGTHWHSHPHPQ